MVVFVVEGLWYLSYEVPEDVVRMEGWAGEVDVLLG